ncbi:MAG TPA: FGGY-family carbohydrate kinase [Polyangiaceae bacterium]|nr:FGGY-family carbohydrate kinase [Polyangiaceae bacterium]
MSDAAYLGIDVGTGSARAGLFDKTGKRLGLGVEPIELYYPEEDFVEQSSENIFRACGTAVRAALAQAGIPAESVRGIGFDATCSLVALGADDRPVTVSPTGRDEQNIVVWMDHRAIRQAERINATRNEVLRYVGGTISPEMEVPKLLWLKEKLPQAFARTARYFDLPDFLVYRATGNDVRSHCTTVCKWTYLGHEDEGRGRWSKTFFEQVGLGELLADGAKKIGSTVRPLGELAGTLTPSAAAELGLVPGIPVGVSIIDAHAGGIGLLGVDLGSTGADALERRLALIGGTSSCHMAVSREPLFIPGVWGPYYSAMLPGLWLSEGGQSATGALIDHTIQSHARHAELEALAKERGVSVYALLNERLDALFAELALREPGAFPALLTRDLHVLPDHHGNRSPRADPTLRGMISGLKLSASIDSLALAYYATIQAIAHGTRHIVEVLNNNGYSIETLVACGGDCKNPVFVREHADATGCRLLLPEEPEAVLLGSAILGAVAAKSHSSVLEAMTAMSRPARVVEPGGGEVARYHEARQRVFQRLYQDQMAYRALMTF